MDYIVHGILQARILEWVAFPFSRGSSQPRDRTQVSHIAGGFFTNWAGQESPGILEWEDSPMNLPDPGMEPRSPALQADSLPTELSGNIILKNFSFTYIQSTLLCSNATESFNLLIGIHITNSCRVRIQGTGGFCFQWKVWLSEKERSKFILDVGTIFDSFLLLTSARHSPNVS